MINGFVSITTWSTQMRNTDFCFDMISPYGLEGARGVMVIVLENGHGDTSSNPDRDWLHFT